MQFSNEEIFNICPSNVPMNEPLWPFKQDKDQLAVLKSGDIYTFASQYQQCPTSLGGTMFKENYWKMYDILPADIDLYRIYGDTAQKTSEHNDYSVFQLWARSRSTGIYLVDQIRGKWEAPMLERRLIEFWDKHKPHQFKPLGAQVVMIEDKSSGSSLIQAIKAINQIPIEPIQRNTDKVLRAMGVVKFFASGYIHLPKGAEFISDYKEEFSKFSPQMTHRHDDQIDPTMDAVEDLIVFENMIYSRNSL